MIKLTLSSEALDTVMKGLTQLPWAMSNNVIQDVLKQANDKEFQNPTPVVATPPALQPEHKDLERIE